MSVPTTTAMAKAFKAEAELDNAMRQAKPISPDVKGLYAGISEDVDSRNAMQAMAYQQAKGTETNGIEPVQALGDQLITPYQGGYRGLRSIADFKTTKTEYVDFLPLRKGFTIASGGNDVGKSSTIEHLAARILLGTTQGAWHGKPKGVIFVLSEDDPADIKAVMNAQDVSDWIIKKKLFTFVDGETAESLDYETVSIPQDVDYLRGLCKRLDIGLVVFDALIDCMDGAHLNDRADVSRAIKPLNAWGNEEDVLLIGVHHNNKSYEGTAKQAVSGSSAFTDKPRTVMSFEKNNDDDTVMQLVKIKGTSQHPAFVCKWITKTITKDDGRTDSIGIVDRIVPSDVSIDDIRRAKTQIDPEESKRTSDGEVLDWLTDFLRDNPASFKTIAKAAAEEGYTRTQLDHARRRADNPGIESVPDPNHRGPGQHRLWQLSNTRQ